MQTPLQMLIEILDREALDNTGFYTPGEFEVIASVKKHATELLEKERDVICKAFSDGKHHGANGSNPNDRNKRYNYLTSQYWEDTFTKTFTDESK